MKILLTFLFLVASNIVSAQLENHLSLTKRATLYQQMINAYGVESAANGVSIQKINHNPCNEIIFSHELKYYYQDEETIIIEIRTGCGGYFIDIETYNESVMYLHVYIYQRLRCICYACHRIVVSIDLDCQKEKITELIVIEY